MLVVGYVDYDNDDDDKDNDEDDEVIGLGRVGIVDYTILWINLQENVENVENKVGYVDQEEEDEDKDKDQDENENEDEVAVNRKQNHLKSLD